MFATAFFFLPISCASVLKDLCKLRLLKGPFEIAAAGSVGVFCGRGMFSVAQEIPREGEEVVQQVDRER